MERWSGKVAVVTGASSGIGWAITRMLLAAGVRVVGLSLAFDETALLAQLNEAQRAALSLRVCDISDTATVRDSFQWIQERYKRVHVLVNDAGMAHITKLLDEGNEASLKRVIDVNLLGTVYCTKQAYRLMQPALEAGEECHIITVNSLLGHTVPLHIPDCGLNLYPVAKHALRAMHEVLRRELYPHKLMRLSSISPGLTNTNFGSPAVEGACNTATQTAYQDVQVLQPEDIARGVEFILASPPHVIVAELLMVPHERY